MSNDAHKNLVDALNGKVDDIGAYIQAWQASRFSYSQAIAYIDAGVLGPEGVEESDNRPAEPELRHTASEDSQPSTEEVPVKPYDEWTGDELSEELTTRELPHSGTKAEKIARLEANDLEDEAKAQERA